MEACNKVMKSYQCVTGSESFQGTPERPLCEAEKFTFAAMETLACWKCQDVGCPLRKVGGMEEDRLTETVCVLQAAELELWALGSSGNSMTRSRLGVCNTALALHWSSLASLSPHSPYQNKNVYSVILSIGVTYGFFLYFILQELSVKRLH